MNCSGAVKQYPLSPMQQGMLFHYLRAPGAGTDIEQIVCTLCEDVDVPSLRCAWERVIERHDVLRTTFQFEESGDPVQIVQRQVTVPWQEYDWRELAKEELPERFEMFLSQDRHCRFDVHTSPLCRLTLMRTDDTEYRLLWTFHHALLDGRSFPLVLNEVFAFYESFRLGQELELPLPRPYADFIEWLQSHDCSKSETYWRGELEGFTGPTPLVLDHAANLGNTGADRQGDSSIFVSESITSALNSFVQDHGLTLNNLLQAAWALLLSKYSGEENVAFGVVRACRKSTIENADSMVGLFINTLPLRVRVPSDALLYDWLKQVRAQWVEMRDHEHTPLVQIQKWSNIPAGQPLFESILMFENYELNRRLREQGEQWGNRTFRLYEQTGYPITLTVYSGVELCLQIEFDRGRVDHPTITRMLGHIKTLLEGMLSGLDQPLKRIRYLTQEERQQLTVEWNGTLEKYAGETMLQRRFETQVKLFPDSVAVVFGDEQLTYCELNSRANQLAHYLQGLGVRPDDLVGICVERSADMLVAMLGVLKAGGAYIPLDPSFPKERLGHILADAPVRVLVTQRRLMSALPVHPTNVLYLDAREMSLQSYENPDSEVRPENLAYVIFTSGSTGRPKGVQIEHRALMNFITSMAQEPGLDPEDILVAVTTCSFDISGLELFLPLVKGARVVIADRESVVDGRRLTRLLETSGATVMQATPATWRMLLQSGWTGRKSMKILCGGEVMTPDLARELIQRCSSLWNMYGPTETTIWSTIWRVTSVEGPIPIGRPIANTQVYILDRNSQPVPVGIPGELFIGGRGVARGYWQRPNLTAERFVPSPFSQENTARLYKTGDLCRWKTDGTIEWLGRNDQQVKIRGFRIELEDVEAALVTHPDIKQAAVIVQEKLGGENKLVAHIVGSSENLPRSEELRKYLGERLPDYMIPSLYVFREKLPLTPNGKLDRKALPQVDDFQHALESEYLIPASETERKIAQVWEHVLGVSGVGRNSNFFDLGGDSLSILRACNMLEEVLAQELSVIELFRRPTVISLAQFVHSGDAEGPPLVKSRHKDAARKMLARRRLSRRKVRPN